MNRAPEHRFRCTPAVRRRLCSPPAQSAARPSRRLHLAPSSAIARAASQAAVRLSRRPSRAEPQLSQQPRLKPPPPCFSHYIEIQRIESVRSEPNQSRPGAFAKETLSFFKINPQFFLVQKKFQRGPF